jgi:hypothetical protein
VKKNIALLIAALGFVFLLWTAGASDADMISFSDVVWRCLISLAMMVGGMGAAWMIEKRSDG